MFLKTRFAPSPTGGLHIGSIRTALYSWLFARKFQGLFALRIEDTDVKRNTVQSTKEIIDVLGWLGLDWDEGPIFQSSRLRRYTQVVDLMLVRGKAYKCYCTQDRLEKIRIEQLMNKKKPRYDRRCRYRTIKNRKSNVPFVVRFKNPISGSVVFKDEVRGTISFKNEELDDLIIQRVNGSPTYNFCVVVDDMDMEVTHVIRGEDHINNTPRQINILTSLGKIPPRYAHISMVVDSYRKKISKRHDSDNIIQYYKQGFLKEAILNYAMRLGWSYGNKEIFSLDEMISLFSLDGIGKSSSGFDIDKLIWFNRYYLNTLPIIKISNYLNFFLRKKQININKNLDLTQIVELFKTRCSTLQDIVSLSNYLYQELNYYDDSLFKKYLNLNTILTLIKTFKKLYSIDHWSYSNIHKVLYLVTKEMGINFKLLGMPLRIAVTGNDISPSIDKIIFLIGKTRVLIRIKNAINHIFRINDN